jgi:hypothetical protein
MRGGRNIIVIGAGAGSMEAMRDICGGLPRDLPAAVFIVVHTGPSSPRVMSQGFAASGACPLITPTTCIRSSSALSTSCRPTGTCC